MKSASSSNFTENRFSRMMNWSERHEGWTMLIIALFTITVVMIAKTSLSAYGRHTAITRAKTLTGKHTFVNAKWFMFQNRIELFEKNQTEGQGTSVPTNSEFGSKLMGEFIKPWTSENADPKLQLPITVDISFSPEAQNVWPKDSYTRDYIEGAYLHFHIASAPPSSSSVAQTKR